MAWYESILGEDPIGQLALPAARIRRALAGQNPFVDYRELLSGQQQAPSGREVFEQWGLASPDSGMWADALGWVGEEATNPLNYIPLGRMGMLKSFGGNVAIGAGLSAAGGAFSSPPRAPVVRRPPRVDTYDELEMMLDQMLMQPFQEDGFGDDGFGNDGYGILSPG